MGCSELRRVLVLAALCLSPGSVPADSADFDRQLRAHVREGQVDYAGWKADSQALERYVESLDRPLAGDVSPEARKALWINAYNACVIRGVIAHLPLKSVKDVEGFFDRMSCRVAGRGRTLNELEGELREMSDPRIHFALVCAAKSCPPLRREAYVGEHLDAQLDEQTRRFLADVARGLSLDEKTGVASLSRIFEWYATDFAAGTGGSDGILRSWRPYLGESRRSSVESRSWTIEYLPYDWALNDRGEK